MELGIKEISDGIFMLTLPMPVGLEDVNIYAFVNGERVSIIDTGPRFPGMFSALEKGLGGIGRKVSDIERIFISHFHVDHCGLAGAVQEISGAAVFIRDLEYDRINTDPDLAIGLLQSFYRKIGMPDEVFSRFAGILKMFRKAAVPFNAEKFLEPGTIEDLDGIKLEIMDTPGHTSGHVAFFCRERGILFSGDHIIAHIAPNLSPDVADPGFNPLRSFAESLDALKGLPVSMVCPAHGLPFPDLDRRIEELKVHLAERKGLMKASVNDGPKTAYEVSSDVFGTEISDFDGVLALNETYVYLEQLEAESVLRRKTVNGLDIYTVN